MAENKKSFVLYSDSYGLIKQLPDDVAGRLLKHIYAYVNDENPVSDELLLNVAFEPIKAQLKRDLAKWGERMEQRRLAGKKSAEQRATKVNDRSTKPNDRSISFGGNVNVNDSVSVSDNVNDSVINDLHIEAEEKKEPQFASGLFLNEIPKDKALTEMETNNTIVFISLQCKKELTPQEVADEWAAFKINHFDKKEWKPTWADVVSHFRNALRKQLNDKNNGKFKKSAPTDTSKPGSVLVAC